MLFFCLLHANIVYCNIYEINENTSLISLDEKENLNNDAAKTDRWLAIDKLQHFSYSCLISLGCQYIFVNKYKKSEMNSLPLSSGLSFSAGLLKELNDNSVEKGHFSIKDMVANLAGITVAAIIIIHDE